VPPHGYAHLLRVNGRPLEDLVSRRAITAAYGSAQGTAASQAAASQAAASQARSAPGPATDVDAIARLAASGDDTARTLIGHAIGTLGLALRPWLVRFGAEILVVGGGIAGSWELVGPTLERALLREETPAAPAWRGGVIVRACDPEESNPGRCRLERGRRCG
jgi:glucokinase